MGIDYSKVMKKWEPTEYDWQIKQREEWKKKREKDEKEAAILQAKLEKTANEKTDEFVEQFKNHPISDDMIEQLRRINPSNRKRVDPVYILDKQLNILAIAESKNLVGRWLYRNGHSKKILGRSTIFEYLRNSLVYKDMFIFVESKKYEEFAKKMLEKAN